MTGDGAVVRVDHAKAASWARDLTHNPMRNDPTGGFANLARAYLAQAAEIERLKTGRSFGVHMCQRMGSPCDELKASEARAAALIEERNRFRDRYQEVWDAGHAHEVRAAELLKALETMRDECQKRTGFLEKLKTEPNECGDVTGLSAWGQCSLTDYTIFLNSLNALLIAFAKAPS